MPQPGVRQIKSDGAPRYTIDKLPSLSCVWFHWHCRDGSSDVVSSPLPAYTHHHYSLSFVQLRNILKAVYGVCSEEEQNFITHFKGEMLRRQPDHPMAGGRLVIDGRTSMSRDFPLSPSCRIGCLDSHLDAGIRTSPSSGFIREGV